MKSERAHVSKRCARVCVPQSVSVRGNEGSVNGVVVLVAAMCVCVGPGCVQNEGGIYNANVRICLASMFLVCTLKASVTCAVSSFA